MNTRTSFVVWGTCSLCLILCIFNMGTFEKQLKETSILAYHNHNRKMTNNSLRTLKQVLLSLGFIKTGSGYCKDIIVRYNETRPGLEFEGFGLFLKELEQYDTLVGEIGNSAKKKEKLEGYSAQLPTSLEVYWRLANLPFVKTVCETGFNAGHSSFLWLSANPNLRVYSFDIGVHKYAKKMANHLQSQFPNRLNVTWGDSTKTLPTFRSNHLDVKCDLVIIDGGHSVEVAISDFDNFYHLASDIHVVLMDDHPAIKADWSVGPRAAWERGKLTGHLYEIGGCTVASLRRGISLGFFISAY